LRGAKAEHRAFLNRYYGASHRFYDVTRKYYLFGRDTTLRLLSDDPRWRSLVEVGPGTGRNLARLHRSRPDAMLGGVDASDAMLAHARSRHPWAILSHGFAEDARLRDCLGTPPDRILFSYCLSMVRGRAAALANARRSVGSGGEVVVVDFADLAGFPSGVALAFRRYLAAFHVEPLDADALSGAHSAQFGPGRYYVIARYPPLPREG
jgi:S-adenosylmethionine-diacylgycerolhomoserine-N-methlytransferase